MHLVGIAASPRGGEIFGSRAEEELRQWLEARLDALGIDPIAYSRFVISLLRRPDSALSFSEEAVGLNRSTERRIRARSKAELPTNDDTEQRRTVVRCLTSAADNECGIETLVDELCIKLKELEGGSSNDENEESKKSVDESKINLEALTPRDRALKYYAAFPALQSVSIKKFSPRKERNLTNCINNKNNGINLHNNKNNKVRNKKTRMSISIESRRLDDKDSFGFAKSMELEREKERELELDQLRLAQLQAKFNESLEALWDSGPGNAQDTASIWAAPTLSIPSGPLWPADTTEAVFTLSTSDNDNIAGIPYQESVVDESPFIPWDIDLISIEEYADECSNKNKEENNINWSDSISDGPWCWKGIDSNLATLNRSPQTGGFFPIAPHKTPIGTCKESRSSLKVNSLPEPDEDLLTSARTHFRPIKDDGHWADGTTFPVNNAIERVAYRRSESGNLLYLPGGESPYMEYRENNVAAAAAVSTNLTLKFRVRQCDKCVQTDPIRSPVKRRIISEQDRFHYSPIGAEEIVIQEEEEEDVEKDFFSLDQLGWVQSSVPPHNDRKRRHSSSFGCQPLTTLRPLTL